MSDADDILTEEQFDAAYEAGEPVDLEGHAVRVFLSHEVGGSYVPGNGRLLHAPASFALAQVVPVHSPLIDRAGAASRGTAAAISA